MLLRDCTVFAIQSSRAL